MSKGRTNSNDHDELAMRTRINGSRRQCFDLFEDSGMMPVGYTDSDFQSDPDSRKSTSGSMFTLNGGAIVWRSVKQSCIYDFTMEAEYVAASEVVKEVVWLCNFLRDLEIIPNLEQPMVIYCDNSGADANRKEPRSHQRGKHIERKFHLIK